MKLPRLILSALAAALPVVAAEEPTSEDLAKSMEEFPDCAVC